VLSRRSQRLFQRRAAQVLVALDLGEFLNNLPIFAVKIRTDRCTLGKLELGLAADADRLVENFFAVWSYGCFRYECTKPEPNCTRSAGLAADKGRNVENVFIDKISHRRVAAVRIEALRSRMVRTRILACWPPCGVARRWKGRRIV
jgi:hypothetical protein